MPVMKRIKLRYKPRAVIHKPIIALRRLFFNRANRKVSAAKLTKAGLCAILRSVCYDTRKRSLSGIFNNPAGAVEKRFVVKLCDSCHKSPASVFVENNINGNIMKRALCAVCAMGGSGGVPFEHFIKSFLGGLSNGHFAAAAQTAPSSAYCGRCGLKYDEFRAHGRLGCAQCYQEFRPLLEPVIKNVHGSSSHEGKLPRRTGAHLSAKREEQSLRQLLKRAIAEENYEEAAKYRDAIRELGGGG